MSESTTRRGKVRVAAFSVSIDGFGAGPGQSLDNPMGEGGMRLHTWALSTRTFQRMHGDGVSGETGVDDDYARRSFDNLGAWVLGRNMFGPVRGPWPDDSWKGWWGPNPPYHVPVFVLTQHPRDSLRMEGGTEFHFVTTGIHDALDRALEAAAGKDVRIGGGVSTVRQYLQAGLIDEMHLAITPVIQGRGENLFAGLDLAAMGFECVEHAASPHATHVVLARR